MALLRTMARIVATPQTKIAPPIPPMRAKLRSSFLMMDRSRNQFISVLSVASLTRNLRYCHRLKVTPTPSRIGPPYRRRPEPCRDPAGAADDWETCTHRAPVPETLPGDCPAQLRKRSPPLPPPRRSHPQANRLCRFRSAPPH